MSYLETEPEEGFDIGDADGDRWRKGDDGLWHMLVGDAHLDDIYKPLPFAAVQELHGPLTGGAAVSRPAVKPPDELDEFRLAQQGIEVASVLVGHVRRGDLELVHQMTAAMSQDMLRQLVATFAAAWPLRCNIRTQLGWMEEK